LFFKTRAQFRRFFTRPFGRKAERLRPKCIG
jgi:hypothetical protein